MQENSTETIMLREWETTPRPYSFSWDEIRYLQKHFAKELIVTPSMRKDYYFLTARQYIGTIVLGDKEIVLRPKINNSNIIYMLTYAWGLPRLPDGITSYDIDDEVFEFIVHLFTRELENLLSRGLYKSYMEVEENMAFVKGRFVVNETIKQNVGLKHLNVCRYSEFTEDILENRILKYTVGILLGRNYRNKKIRQRIYRCFLQMEYVSYFFVAKVDFNRLVYTRLNNHYQKLHRLCALFIDNTSFTNEKGNIRFSAFLLDMNKLFEEFVGGYLKEKFQPFPEIQVSLQDQRYLDKKKKIKMKPDIVITKQNSPVLVLDTKYKRLDEGQIKHADVYQMYTYCSTLKVGKGLLLYGEGEGADYDVKVPECLNIETKVLKLTGNHSSFNQECNELFDYVLSWISN